MKKALFGVLAAVAIGMLAIPLHSADAQVRPAPTPILKIVPTFSCSATVSGTNGTVAITKTNAATLDQTTDVVATINTPSGKVSTSVCGKTFSSSATGTKVTSPFTAPSTTDKSWIYTCSAVQTQTTSACKPPG